MTRNAEAGGRGVGLGLGKELEPEQRSTLNAIFRTKRKIPAGLAHHHSKILRFPQPHIVIVSLSFYWKCISGGFAARKKKRVVLS